MNFLSAFKSDVKPWVLNTEFLKALEANDATTVNDILDAGFDIDRNLLLNGKNALNICVTNGWYEMAQVLVRRGCSLSLRDPQGYTPLTLAVQQSHSLIVKLLLENRADLTSIDLLAQTALHYACAMNNLRIVQLLTEYTNPKILNMKRGDMKTPFACACVYGNIDLISHLLSKGSDVNSTDYIGSTPLFHVLTNPHCTTEMVQLLLDAGASISHVNNAKDTPLLSILRKYSTSSRYKSSSQFHDICLLLIERGCNINAFNNLGETALHFAVILNDFTLVRKFLNRGASVDAQNKLNFVPLFYACRNGSLRIASLLLDAGANPRLLTLHGNSHWAWYKHRTVAAEVDSLTLLTEVVHRTKEHPTLGHMCRLQIRKLLSMDIEKRSSQLPLPPFLVDYILLLH